MRAARLPGGGVFALLGGGLRQSGGGVDDARMQPRGPHKQGKAAERRRSGRVRVHMIGSDLGELRDLSSTGARVLCKGGVPPRPGEALWFNVEGVDGRIKVCAKVVWARRQGWFGRELGLEFLGLDAKARAALAALARTAASNQIFGLDRARRTSA